MDQVIVGIISGLVCASLVWLFTQLVDVQATKRVRRALTLLLPIMCSIGNDLIWGAEDEKQDYYDTIITKICSALPILEQAITATKPLNFLCHHRKYICKQYEKIEEAFSICLTDVECASPDLEKIARLQSLYNQLKTTNDNMLVRRTKFILNLIKYHNLDKALDYSAVDDDDKMQDRIRNELAKL